MMTRHIAACWLVSAVCLSHLAGADDSLGQATRSPTDQSDDQAQLSVQLDLGPPTDAPVIDINKPFHIAITNTSDQPIRIWSPRLKNGYHQWSFQFTSADDGRVSTATKREIEDPMS